MSDPFQLYSVGFRCGLRVPKLGALPVVMLATLLWGETGWANPIAQIPVPVSSQGAQPLAFPSNLASAEANPNSLPLAPVAAVSQPTNPVLQPAVSGYQTEEDLIQQMAGKPTSRASRPATSPKPVFTPPAPSVLPALPVQPRPSIPAAAPVPANPANAAIHPFLISISGNSDVLGLGLLSPNPAPSVTGCPAGDRCTSAPSSLVRLVDPTPLGNPFSAVIGQSPYPPSGGIPPQETPATSRDRVDPAPASGNLTPTLTPRSRPFLRSTALSAPLLQLQGVYLYQGDETSARARLSTTYPLTPRVLFGATFDVTTGDAFTDTPEQGFNVNELYLATSLADLPNLRFAVGQLDLTSYFDRNSFAKDGASHFFNPVFQTNPALSTAQLSSRPGLLVNWTLTDNIEAKGAVFSSSRGLGDFALDGFAGELGLRYGNAIIRGTYVSSRDSGSKDGFREIFQIGRENGRSGLERGDREEGYGVNAEVYIPNLKMGIFGRYGRYNNVDLGRGGDTYSLGVTFLDLFAPDDRLGVAYGRQLSNDNLRRQNGEERPDVLEVYYDFRFLSNLRLGFSLQQRNDFSETIAGVRVKTEFDVTPRGRVLQ